MNVHDIIALANAGYTADQINQLAALALQNPAPAPAPAPAHDQFSMLMQQMQQLTGAIQANGIAQSQQPKPETAQDVLASIILPPTLDKKGV